jgi:hypothetical protein
MSENCLVRVRPGSFLKGDAGAALDVTDTPSYGLLLDYDSAVRWVARLRKKGFPEALVTDAAGDLMTIDRIKMIRAAEKVDPTIPRSWEEFDRIPAGELTRRYRTESAFADAIDALEKTPRAPRKPAINSF